MNGTNAMTHSEGKERRRTQEERKNKKKELSTGNLTCLKYFLHLREREIKSSTS